MKSLLTLVYQYAHYFRVVLIHECRFYWVDDCSDLSCSLSQCFHPSPQSMSSWFVSFWCWLSLIFFFLCDMDDVLPSAAYGHHVRMIPRPFIFSVVVRSLIVSAISSCLSVCVALLFAWCCTAVDSCCLFVCIVFLTFTLFFFPRSKEGWPCAVIFFLCISNTRCERSSSSSSSSSVWASVETPPDLLHSGCFLNDG